MHNLVSMYTVNKKSVSTKKAVTELGEYFALSKMSAQFVPWFYTKCLIKVKKRHAVKARICWSYMRLVRVHKKLGLMLCI